MKRVVLVFVILVCFVVVVHLLSSQVVAHLSTVLLQKQVRLTASEIFTFLSILVNGFQQHLSKRGSDRIPSTTPGAEPPRDDRDSGSARSHSTHLETSSSDRPKMVTYTEPQTVSSYMSVECTRRTLRMPIFTRATHAQPSLSDFPWRDSDFWRAGTLTRDDPGGTKFSHFPPK